MQDFVNLLTYGKNIFNSMIYSSENLIMRETSSFGSLEWSKYFGINVDSPNLSDSLSLYGNNPCPFWPGRFVKETHFLCLIPEGIDAEVLWSKLAKQRLPIFMANSSLGTEKAYWIWITKETLPDSRSKSFDEQKREAVLHHYQIPTVLEAVIAVLALKHSANLSVYPSRGRYTRCQEEIDGWPLAVGSDPDQFFGVMQNDWNCRNGVAGVFKG